MIKKRLRTLGAAVAAMVLVTIWFASPASAALNSCPYGSYAGSTYADLTNGSLNAGFCSGFNPNTSNYAVRTVNIQYKKTAGGTVTLRFGWQIINNTATTTSFEAWDQGAFTQSAGQTKTYQWKYPTAGPLWTGSGSGKCVRGIMKDMNTSFLYVTTLLCI